TTAEHARILSYSANVEQSESTAGFQYAHDLANRALATLFPRNVVKRQARYDDVERQILKRQVARVGGQDPDAVRRMFDSGVVQGRFGLILCLIDLRPDIEAYRFARCQSLGCRY